MVVKCWLLWMAESSQARRGLSWCCYSPCPWLSASPSASEAVAGQNQEHTRPCYVVQLCFGLNLMIFASVLCFHGLPQGAKAGRVLRASCSHLG